jgi:hypothetical protein
MQSVFVKFYEPLPKENIILPANELENFLNDAPSKYGVVWVQNNQREGVAALSTSERNNKREPKPKHLWSRTYHCHREGTKQSRKNVVNGESSGSIRSLQRPSKKIGCPAKLRVIYFLNDPNHITLIHVKEHNHNVSDSDELQHLPLSAEVKKYIIDRLEDGFDKRHIRLAIQRSFSSFISKNLNFTVVKSNSPLGSIIHRDQMVHADEIYNLFYKIQKFKFQRHANQYESVKEWLKELQTENFDIFTDNDSFYRHFTFGFLSPQQKQLLLEAKSWCLDATHNTTNFDRGLL